MGDPAKRYARANLYPCQFSSALYVEPCDRCPDCRFQAVPERDRAVRERDELAGAVNDYLVAQNWAGYRDGNYGHDEGCRVVRRRLCETVYRLHPDPPEQEGRDG